MKNKLDEVKVQKILQRYRIHQHYYADQDSTPEKKKALIMSMNAQNFFNRIEQRRKTIVQQIYAKTFLSENYSKTEIS